MTGRNVFIGLQLLHHPSGLPTAAILGAFWASPSPSPIPPRMSSSGSCECGWKGSGGTSTRALTAHKRVCKHLAAKASSNLPKRRAAEIDMSDLEGGLSPLEPPRKTPRRLVR